MLVAANTGVFYILKQKLGSLYFASPTLPLIAGLLVTFFVAFLPSKLAESFTAFFASLALALLMRYCIEVQLDEEACSVQPRTFPISPLLFEALSSAFILGAEITILRLFLSESSVVVGLLVGSIFRIAHRVYRKVKSEDLYLSLGAKAYISHSIKNRGELFHNLENRVEIYQWLGAMAYLTLYITIILVR